MFAGAVDADASSLGVTLYQYTASITEHRVLAAMRFIVRWDLSTIPLPAGTYAHRNLENGESRERLSAKGRGVICEKLNRRPPLAKYGLQLPNNAGSILAW